MDQIKENWNLIKTTLKKEYELTDVSFNTWIEPLKYHSTVENLVTIMIPSDQSNALTYISKKYKNYFQVTISEMMDNNYEVRFVLENDNEAINETPSLLLNNNTKYEEANLNPKYRFDNFVRGGSNNIAFAASLAVAESPGEVYNPLYLYGGAGLGKTHLMHSIGHFILEQNNNKKVLYVTSEHFTNELIESIRSGNEHKMTQLREKYRTVDVLLIDDIQFIIGKEKTQEEFFHTFNVLHTAGKQIVLSSDKPPRDMEILDERIRSRFEWGLMADIQPPDYETRMAILRKNAEKINKYVDDKILEYIAENIKSNIRELEGAFNKIIAYSKLNNVDITEENAKEALKDIIYPESSKILTPDYIIEVVANAYNVSPSDIKSRKRNAEIAFPRQVVMYLCRDLIDISLTNIGKILGNKDHTTVIHGVKKIEDELKINDELRIKIENIKKTINP